MQPNDSIKEITKSVPESFYDALAYIIPGTFFIICPYLLIDGYKDFINDYYNNCTVIFDKIIIAIVVLFSSYVIGQILTSLSWIFTGIIFGYFSKFLKIRCWI